MSTAIKGHELAGEFAALDELLAESEGELTPEIEALLAELEEKAEDKIHRTALVVLRYLSEAKAIKEEEARLAARRKAKERAAEGLKGYLERVMATIGKERVEGVLATIAFQNNPPALEVDDLLLDEVQLRTIYMVQPELVTRHPETFALNKRAVLDLAKAKQPIPAGCEVVVRKSLRIR